MNFIGLNTTYTTADQQEYKRIHLDGAASPLAAKTAIDTLSSLLPHYSNSHSYVHNSAQVSTKALAWAHQSVLNFVGASSAEYTCVFTGSGCTAAINRLARGLLERSKALPVVLVSAMEHHANDLPHRSPVNQVVYLPLAGSDDNLGSIDVEQARNLLDTHKGKVNYMALSSVSNVTGISNDWQALTELAHEYGAKVILDAAQSMAHQAIDLNVLNPAQRPDFIVFSGHKLFTPFGPGVLVGRKNELKSMSGQNMGGGSVSTVSPFDFELVAEFPDREQSGTPNIVGSVALARVLCELKALPLESVAEKENKLMAFMLSELNKLSFITIYGDPELPRTGALAFNHKSIEHGLLAAILNDYYAIALRNECFCAHPYVSALLKSELWDIELDDEMDTAELEMRVNQRRGMVRASISLYTSKDDIKQLVAALVEVDARIDSLRPNYVGKPDGSFEHRTFKIEWPQTLDWIEQLD